MSQQLMRTRQQSTPGAQWAVAAGQALRLHVGPGERELHVTDGRLWLTREGTAHSPSEDIWLQAGDSVAGAGFGSDGIRGLYRAGCGAGALCAIPRPMAGAEGRRGGGGRDRDAYPVSARRKQH